jgi:hypothetical protein
MKPNSLSACLDHPAELSPRRLAGLAMSVVLVLGLGACDGDKASPAGPTSGANAGKPYPLDVCVVSGKPLGSMGEPFTFVHEGQEIKLCCEPCLAAFKKDPSKHLAKLVQATKPAPQAPTP